MSRTILLDNGPLGLVTNPRGSNMATASAIDGTYVDEHHGRPTPVHAVSGSEFVRHARVQSVHRGWAWHVDGCPIPARVWKGKAYANVIDDCTGCRHMLTASSDVGVICDGFRALGRDWPTTEGVPRPPPEEFEHPDEEDPMRAVDRWLHEQRSATRR